MAYENVSLPYGEERIFDVPVWGERRYSNFTIDEEKDYVFFRGVVDRDRPDEQPFYFYFKGEIIPMIMFGENSDSENVIKWKLLDINIPNSLDRDEVFAELRKAVKVYGVHGFTEKFKKLWKKRTGNDWDPNGTAIIDF